MQYGIIIGRFQPLHAGHQSIINEIMHDGLIPVVLIGSSTAVDESNPLTYAERSSLIHQIYGGGVITLPLSDKISDKQWVSSIKLSLLDSGIHSKECCIYYWHKKGDLNIGLLLDSFKFKQPTYPDIYEGLSATKIRNDPDKYKKYLDGRVYHKIKDLAK